MVMKRTPLNQNGFIPMLLLLLVVVVAVIYIAYTRVTQAQ
jgi:hypothetical protein